MEIFLSNIDEPSRHILSEINQTWNDRLEKQNWRSNDWNSGKLSKELKTGAEGREWSADRKFQ